MIRRPPSSKRTDTLFPYATFFRSSLTAPLYISAFAQEDGSYNVVWSRPTRRRDLASEMAPKANDSLPPLPGEGNTAGAPAQGAEAGLGQSSAEHAFVG